MRAKMLSALILSIVISSTASAAVLDYTDGAQSRNTNTAWSNAGRPAYRLVEGFSDGVYNFMRCHLIGNILPSGLTRELPRSPTGDSYALFENNFGEKETRYLQRLREAYPIQAEFAKTNEERMGAWRSWAAEEQLSVAIDSLGDTLMDRYQLQPFGNYTGRYAQDRRNWDPGFLTMAGLMGSTFLYLSGLHTDAEMGQWKMGIDLRSGLLIRQAIQNRQDASRVASVEVGYKNNPVTAATEWGLAHGNFRGESIGLKYRLRY